MARPLHSMRLFNPYGVKHEKNPADLYYEESALTPFLDILSIFLFLGFISDNLKSFVLREIV